ncbi:hypothetical protein VNO77_05323 [Canavalia gladiata]|uniref:Uncharacterized protein n=1 Tax=Canavalia gladiata TaxID=3824 RepID=A0AAN9MYS5_CANGL
MGNCGSNPKTDEGPEPVEEPVAEDVQVEQRESVPNPDTKTEETPKDSDNKCLGNLLNEKEEEAAKTEKVKAEAKTEEVKV